MKKATRSRRSGFRQGDDVEVRINDAWLKGKVSRSLFKGVEVDVRLEDGRVMKNLTAKDVRVPHIE